MSRILTVIAGTALLAGCATAPEPLRGEFSPVSPTEARGEVGAGEVVRWGGVIVDARPLAEETCLEVLSREIGSSGRPSEKDSDHGRFIACKSGFLDPANFKEGREVTVVGRIDGVTDHKIGEYEYRYPALDAEVVYLWPQRRDYARRPYYYGPYYHPFHYPFHYPFSYRYSLWYRHHGFGPKAGTRATKADGT